MEQRTIQTQESAERIDALLARSLPGLTRSAAQRLLAQGAVTKDGAPVKKNYRTVPGDTFVVTLPDAAPSELVAQDLPLDVVYEYPNKYFFQSFIISSILFQDKTSNHCILSINAGLKSLTQ